MSLISRRKFAVLAGLATAAKVLTKSASAQHLPGEHTPNKEHADAPVQAKPAVKPVAKTVPAKVDRESASPEEIWNDLMEGNKRFAAGKPAVRDVIGARARTAGRQQPFVIVLCCSDSRLSPEIIFDQNIGDLFVVRTAGNVADPIDLGSMEYAVEHLGSRMLVVLGHEKCGAVSATLSGEKMPTDNLTALVEKIKPGVDRLKGLVTGDTLISLAVEANVHHSAADVIEDSPIIRHNVASGGITVVKAVYNIATGEVRRLSNPREASADNKTH